jgi:hypothetical protein
MNTCEVCGQKGQNGAQWLVIVAGFAPRRVHRPCGDKALKQAPEGTKAKVIPSKELRMQWRDQKQVKSFWEGKFAEAKALKKA